VVTCGPREQVHSLGPLVGPSWIHSLGPLVGPLVESPFVGPLVGLLVGPLVGHWLSHSLGPLVGPFRRGTGRSWLVTMSGELVWNVYTSLFKMRFQAPYP
jgi:hypothetical protein